MLQIGQYVTQRQEQEKNRFIEYATLLNGLAQQLIAGLNLKRPKIITPKELYPNLFDTQKVQEKIPEKHKQKLIADAWRGFLGRR